MDSGERLRAGELGVPLRGRGRRLPRGRRAPRRRARADGAALARPVPGRGPTWALLAATYAKWIGRGVAFSLAALRQAFAAGRDLTEPDNVLIAAAACEMHPTAVSRARAGASAAALDEATDARGRTA